MTKTRLALGAALALGILCAPLVAQSDDFKREGSGAKRAKKDALEKKTPPALQVTGWMNTKDGKPIALKDLEGKVVVLDFWGVW